MTDVVGLELTPGVVRAVAVGPWRARPRAVLELDWDPQHPEALVHRLRDQLGAPRRLALAVGLAFLQVKRVRLPPAPAEARRAMLHLEPDRFFPVSEGALVVSLLDAEDLAFAVDADLLERWLRAFEEWAPVETVEAAPVTAARALGRDGRFAVEAAAGERGLLEIEGGRLRSVRRVPAAAEAPEGEPLPPVGGVSGALGAALGAARAADPEIDSMLLPETHRARARRGRFGRLAASAATCALSVLVALWALDRSRERTLDRLDDEIARTRAAAEAATALRERLGALELEAAALDRLEATRADPLPVLAALSERLPGDATVLSARATGSEWQIDGTAVDAAALVPLLDRDELFQDVRVLSASARFRSGDRTYETFSIAFRADPSSD